MAQTKNTWLGAREKEEVAVEKDRTSREEQTISASVVGKAIYRHLTADTLRRSVA